jgi:hypothetical protein
MYYGQINELGTSWETFRRVEIYNSNISTQRGNGNTSLSYYQFFNNQERTLWRQGQTLFVTYLGYTSTIQKN